MRAAPAKRGRRGRKWSGPAAEHPRTVGLRWVSAGPPMPRSGITAGPPRGGVASASAGPLHAGPPAIRCVRAVAASVSEGAPAGSELPEKWPWDKGRVVSELRGTGGSGLNGPIVVAGPVGCVRLCRLSVYGYIRLRSILVYKYVWRGWALKGNWTI